ncbi:UDP-3-O-(3-hydroxymyristoyl)glucosamine N-acyltransferase [Acuticoccus sp.]|uniref:UDP-3-O-(3-hydroxymyristoyl)glucosamine N-acyltransferase n=1 Tax=Acuticoccus sp. TaxID=1904378 RepID=UPI003B528639
MSRFFPPADPLLLGAIADAVGATVDGTARERIMSDVMPLDTATAEHVSFLRNPRHRRDLETTRAGAVFVQPRFLESVPEGCAALLTERPANAFGLAAALFHPSAMRPRPLTSRGGGEVASSAIVEEPGGLEANVIVEAFAVVARGVEVGRGSVIGPNVVIGPGCTIGRGTVIGANTTVQCAHIGDRVIIHPGVRIGQDGFGLARTPKGYQKVPQVGAVVIQDDVEIGANSCVDRGSRRDTVIGKGTKIDNMVMVGHNVSIGCHCVIAGCVGIAGSVTLGDSVTIGGGSGLRDGITIGAGASIAGFSGVGDDVPEGATWGGNPAIDAARYFSERKQYYRLLRSQSAAPKP